MATKKTNGKNTLFAAVLSRVASALKDKTVELKPGVYEIDETVRIHGEINVGEPTSRVSLGVSDGDLAAVLIDRMAAGNRANAVRYAVAKLAAYTDADLKRAKATKKELVERYAEAEGLITEADVAGRVTGAPRIEFIKSNKDAKAA